jgi:NH3-dependent NAD+ synthetase
MVCHGGSATTKHQRAVLYSCLRAAVLRFLTHYPEPALLMGTGNRDEDELLRFYQKGGDGAVDNNWLGGLHKSEVWELAAYLGIPQEIIDAEPSPDLWGGAEHLDEAELEQLTGVKLTYLRPGTGEATPENGSIEWVTRANDLDGVINGVGAIDPGMKYTQNRTAWEIIAAVKAFERKTRHKAQMPPKTDRREMEREGLVK